MGLRDKRRPGSNALFVGGVVATVVIHGGIVAAALAGQSHQHAPPPSDMFGKVVDVQAVKFGKPRDMRFLPHKEAPAPQARPKLALTQNEKALPHIKTPDEKEKDKPVDDDPLKRTHAHQFENLPDDQPSTGSNEPEGDPNGQKGGTATVGKGPIYYQHLQAAIQNAWNVPTTISDSALSRLKAMACIKIDATGKIVEFALKTPSGNERFDATLLEALSSLKQLEPPTDDVKEDVTTDGVCMNFAKAR